MMKEADAYLLIPKEYLVGGLEGNVKNTHIFDCTRSPYTREWTVSNVCRCGKVNCCNDLSNLGADICKTPLEIREKAARQEGVDGVTICGRCVATLYTDGD